MRECGVLLHISSLPSKWGIGSLGREAFKFVDFLAAARQNYWQVLPLGQTSYGDSPYQTFSVFAGNPYFIDLDLLIEEGLLKLEDIKEYDWKSDTVDYSGLFHYRYDTLRKIDFSLLDRAKLSSFYRDNAFWLEDYALFMAVKMHYNFACLDSFDEGIKHRHPLALKEYSLKLKKDIEFFKALQFLFFRQWNAVKEYANLKGIKIIGDMPIYVAYDSADVWSNPNFFNLDKDLRMVTVAGCPPDYFSKTGQLWGNPIYDWSALKADGFNWWINRIKAALSMFDKVRIDHFRGFASYYEIPYGRSDATVGRWQTGIGYEFFKRLKDVLPDAQIIAEDLGTITPDVHELLRQTGLAGMKVLQFGMDENSDHNVKNYKSDNYIVYSGTHDNDTSRGWFEGLLDGSQEKKNALLLMKEFKCKSFSHALIQLAYKSICKTVIIPMQDILNLSSSARMNFPSTVGNNWKWRLPKDALSKKNVDFLSRLAVKYNRI